MDAAGLTRSRMAVTLYTDSYVVRGTIPTLHRRLSDLLNGADRDFIVLEDVFLDEFGSRDLVQQAPFAQINLATVLFAVADQPVEPVPELRVVKVPEQALVVVPPFRITGRVHLPPQSELRSGLDELTGRFVPVTDATYWSDPLKEPRTRAAMLAVNHARAHILAPYVERDVWGDEPALRRAEGAAELELPADGSAAAPDPGLWVADTNAGPERSGAA